MLGRMSTEPLLGFQDPVSSWLHLGGALVFLLLAPRLLWRGRGHPGRVFSLVVFVLAVEIQLGLSGTYHLLADGTPARAVLRRLDHAAIFVLIAGTFTPGHAILFRGWLRWGILAFVWSFAVASITLKTVFFQGFPEWLGLVMYLSLGWLGAVSGYAAWRRYGYSLVSPVLLGGVAYTAGAVLEFLRWPTLWPGVLGPHELFHLFVLLGVGLHWRFIYRFAHGAWAPRASVQAREAEGSGAPG